MRCHKSNIGGKMPKIKKNGNIKRKIGKHKEKTGDEILYKL